MIRTSGTTFFAFLLLTLLLPTDGWTHRVNVFAWHENGTIFTESSFSGGRKAKGARIEVRRVSDGQLVEEGVTDESGNWFFTLPDDVIHEGPELSLVVLAGEGHRGEWVLKPEDYQTSSSEGKTLVDKRQGPGLLKILAGVLVLLGAGAFFHMRRKS